MPFEQTVEAHHVVDFDATVQLALQQYGPILRPYVDMQTCEGERSALITLFGRTDAQTVSGRKPENLDIVTPRSKRWLIYNDPIANGEYVNEQDIWRQAFDPTSSLMQSKVMSVGRAIDKMILTGLTGPAYEGKTGETAIALPAAQIVASDVRPSGSGNTGMNVLKLRNARKTLVKAHVDLDREQAFLALSVDEHDALFDFVTATGVTNFNALEAPVMVNGKLAKFMGFNFVAFQALNTRVQSSDTIRECVAWVKSAAKLGVWSDVRGRMWNDSSRRQTPVIDVDFVGDCRRTEEGKVVRIDCLVPA